MPSATCDLIAATCDAFVELRGDRVSDDDHAVLGGFARLDGRPVMLIGHDTALAGDVAGNVRTNYAMGRTDGDRKLLRLIELAVRLRLPIVTLVDTPGASPDVRSESEGQAGVLGATVTAMLEAPVPTVAVVLGEAGSGGALPLLMTDRLIMLSDSHCSLISPEGIAILLLHDQGRTAEAAQVLELRAADLLAMGFADRLVPSRSDTAGLGQALRATATAMLDEAAALTADLARRTSPLARASSGPR